jgi:hypothetical protein
LFLGALQSRFIMPIPRLTPEGLLPEGVHDCSLAEIRECFGQFQTTDVRCRLFERLEKFVSQAAATGFAAAIIVDGSYVTAKNSPNDIDLILVVRTGHDFSADLRPRDYNVVSRKRVGRDYGFDMLVAEEGQMQLEEHTEFFSQVRERRHVRKGMLRIRL